MKTLIPFIVALLASVAGIAQNAFVTDSLDNYVNREMDRWRIPGLALAIVKDGKIVVMKGYGEREDGKPEKVDEGTLFQIASNTKLFTASGISILNSEKRLTLDDKITKWLPDFRLFDTLATAYVTIRDMLSHRIGFLTFQSDLLNWNCNLSREALIANMRNVNPAYDFRTKWGYCNMGYVVAGQLLEEATDTTWDNYLRIHFFEPLKMKRTNTSYAKLLSDTDVAAAHTIYNDSLVKIPYANIDNIGPCASINSSIGDLTNWLLMQLDTGRYDGKTIVPAAAIKETWKPQMLMGERHSAIFPSMHFAAYGLGLEMNDFAGRKIMHHSGGANGFVTQLMMAPEENLGIIVLTNTDANQLYSALGFQIMESYFGLPYRNISEEFYKNFNDAEIAARAEIKSWNERLAMNPKPALPADRYAGKYNNPVYGDIDIRKEDGKLNIYFSHHPDNIGMLTSYGGNEFVCRYSDITYGIKMISFATENEKVKSVTLRVNDFVDLQPYVFTKVN